MGLDNWAEQDCRSCWIDLVFSFLLVAILRDSTVSAFFSDLSWTIITACSWCRFLFIPSFSHFLFQTVWLLPCQAVVSHVQMVGTLVGTFWSHCFAFLPVYELCFHWLSHRLLLFDPCWLLSFRDNGATRRRSVEHAAVDVDPKIEKKREAGNLVPSCVISFSLAGGLFLFLLLLLGCHFFRLSGCTASFLIPFLSSLFSCRLPSLLVCSVLLSVPLFVRCLFSCSSGLFRPCPSSFCCRERCCSSGAMSVRRFAYCALVFAVTSIVVLGAHIFFHIALWQLQQEQQRSRWFTFRVYHFL